jgi:hypothetical protein
MTDALVVPLPHRNAPARFDETAIERTFELWQTRGCLNAELTARLLAQEADQGDAVPTGQTIRNWAKLYGWEQRAKLEMRETARLTGYQLRVELLGMMRQSQWVKQALMSGFYADNPQVGAMAAKGAELTDRFLERIPKSVWEALLAPPPDDDDDTSALSRDEQEARSRATLIQRKQDYGNWGEGNRR